MAVLLTPPYLQFFDDNGAPLSLGYVYTYAATTSTPKATYTDADGTSQAPNPIRLDASGIPQSGNGSIWGQGSYKVVVTSADGSFTKTTDKVSTFAALTSTSASPYFQSLSGDGTTTSFTLSQDLGTDETAIMVFINPNLQSCVTNGSFATDTDWTKGTGWTIAAGVATATGAISTAISQTSPVTYVQGQAYSVTYTITRSAGGLIPSIGGTNGVERTASGTYNEIIIAGSSQTTAFTGNAFTGTLDNISINVAASPGFGVTNPNTYTLNGTALSFAVAPPTGVNNIFVFAPSTLVGAAAFSASAADASATSAANSAMSAAAYAAAKVKWTFSSTTTMADPGTGLLRLNNAAIASTTAIAISNLSADSGNPDLSAWVATWDDAPASPRGALFIFKDNANFAIFTITGANTDNAGWKQITVTHIASTGAFANTDNLLVGFVAYGASTVTGGITALTGDISASGSGSVAATITAGAVTEAKMTLADNTTNNATTSKHGFLPKLSGSATDGLRGDGTFGVITPQTTSTTLAAAATYDSPALNFTTYSEYTLRFADLTTSAAALIHLWYSVDNGANYVQTTIALIFAAGTTPGWSTSTGALGAVAPSIGENLDGKVTISRPKASAGKYALDWHLNAATTSNHRSIGGMGTILITNDITNIRLAPASGTISGTVILTPVKR